MQIALDTVDGILVRVLTIPELMPRSEVAKSLSNPPAFKMFTIKKLSIKSDIGRITLDKIKGKALLKTVLIMFFKG